MTPIGYRRPEGHYPVILIHTTEDHISLKQQCTDTDYIMGRLRCSEDSANMLHCTENITIQDYTPQELSFSYGFRCDKVNANDSLKGILYNISIYVTNKTECFRISSNDTCYHYSQYGALSNLFGNNYTKDVYGV